MYESYDKGYVLLEELQSFFGPSNQTDSSYQTIMKKYRNMSQFNKDIEIETNRASCPIRREMERLRLNCSFDGIYPFLQMDNDIPYIKRQYIDIIFHNAANLNLRRLNQIRTENGFKSADIMFFAECHTDPVYSRGNFLQRNIPESFVLHRLTGAQDNATGKKSNGLVCLVHREFEKRLIFVADNSVTIGDQRGYFNGDDILEISLHYYINKNSKRIYLCNLYKHPKCSEEKFFNEFTDFLFENIAFQKGFIETIFILGDFNIDKKVMTKKVEAIIKSLKKDYGLRILIDESTTERETCIDWILTNTKNEVLFETYIYESVYTYHKPLYLRIKK
jgi:hypothetical protein